jgi:hypothetical protein
MRKIREALRLTHALGMSRRRVGEATGIGKTAVGEYVRRAAMAGLSWPIPDEIDDAELERRLFPPADAGSPAARTDPDWSHIHTEIKRRGVTLGKHPPRTAAGSAWPVVIHGIPSSCSSGRLHLHRFPLPRQ